jgi:hypothetical protein
MATRPVNIFLNPFIRASSGTVCGHKKQDAKPGGPLQRILAHIRPVPGLTGLHSPRNVPGILSIKYL